nr:MAG TPA: hypothetical protein [Caudoviricetes sp.]
MKTAFNPQRQNFVKYDDKHYLLFLNETEAEQTNEQGETVKGFTYTGTQTDGSTLIEATGVTEQNRRSKFIAGLIGTEYTMDDQIALLANGEDTNEHAEELAIFLEKRGAAKKAVDELLARNI